MTNESKNIGSDLEEENKKLIADMSSLKHKINNSLTGFIALLSLLEERDTDKITIEGEDIYSLIKEEIDKVRGLLKTSNR
ncbi:MAG: hypothetical protein ACE5IH_07605 [Thermodesulfobacteriota bacterium]